VTPLVTAARTRAPLAPVAALRESSVIVGAAIRALFCKERFGAPRVTAAGLMVLGIGLMLYASRPAWGRAPRGLTSSALEGRGSGP